MPGDFGSDFVARPEVVPELGRWYSFELMVKANTPGQRNGRIAMWLDGELIGDCGSLHLRDTETLKIDQVSLDLHLKSNTRAVARKWYDNVVVPGSYIGPMTSADAKRPLPPTDLRIGG